MAYKPYVPNYSALSYTGGSEHSEFSTGYRMQPGIIGAPTNPQTANQIAEVTARLNEGMRAVEVGALGPEVFETIPKQQFREIKALAKLTGSEMTVHAPMIDPSGFSKDGWNESQRSEAERQLNNVIAKSAELGDKNVCVTIHSSGIPAYEWQKEFADKGGKAMMVVVNQETGQLAPVRTEKRFYPTYVGKELVEKGVRPAEAEVRSVEEELEIMNHSEWANTVTNLAHFKKEGDELLREALPSAKAVEEAKSEGRLKFETPESRAAGMKVENAQLYYSDVEARFIGAFSKAYKYGNEQVRENLDKIAEKWYRDRKEISELARKEKEVAAIEKTSEALGDAITNFNKVLERSKETPRIYAPVEDFFKKHSAETIGNVAFKAYKDLGEKAPIIALENFFPEMAFSRAKTLRQLVDASKKQFVEKAVKENHLDRDRAKKIADKLIGVTWDVGHINLLRKGGYGKEEIIKETEKIAPLVKKVHITDNFGFNDTHLPPGMGNVPMKKMMEKLEKEGFSGKAIMEAGGFVQQFKVSPHPYVLEAMGSPIYSESSSPTWGASKGMSGGYFSGYGPFLPEQHFSMYGSGFSGLPTELGGQIPGKQSRLAGTPVD